MKKFLPQVLSTGLFTLSGTLLLAQTPQSAPAENTAPAEVVPPKPPATPAPGQKTVEIPEKKEPLSPGTPPTADKAGTAERAGVDALSEAEIDQALAALKQRYVQPGSISDLELKRATLQGILTRLGAGVVLQISTNGKAAEPSPFRSEVIDGRIGYVRLGEAVSAHVGEFDTALKNFNDQKLPAVVLDLRATPAGTDLEAAAEVTRRFSSKGKVLFTLKKRDAKEQIFTSKDDPHYRGLVITLVDKDTAGSGEIIAAVLRAQAGAMVIGQRTEGKAAEFEPVGLGNGKSLKIAVAEVSLPENVPLFPGGVKPDLAVEVPADVTASVLKQELEGGVGPLITETERPRMNEAALVAGTNPELEAAILAQRSRGEKPKTPLRDTVLQRAIDFITTITIYRKGAEGKR